MSVTLLGLQASGLRGLSCLNRSSWLSWGISRLVPTQSWGEKLMGTLPVGLWPELSLALSPLVPFFLSRAEGAFAVCPWDFSRW